MMLIAEYKMEDVSYFHLQEHLLYSPQPLKVINVYMIVY